jgi:hypothetical protein
MLHVVLSLYSPGQEALVPSGRRQDGPQSRSGRWYEEKHLLTNSGMESGFLGRPASNFVTISIELSRLFTEMIRERNIADIYSTEKAHSQFN